MEPTSLLILVLCERLEHVAEIDLVVFSHVQQRRLMGSAARDTTDARGFEASSLMGRASECVFLEVRFSIHYVRLKVVTRVKPTQRIRTEVAETQIWSRGPLQFENAAACRFRCQLYPTTLLVLPQQPSTLAWSSLLLPP